MPRENIKISIEPLKVGIFLEFVTILTVLLSLSVQALFYIAGSAKAGWWLPLVNADKELSIPSLLSVMQFYILAFLLAIVGRITEQTNDPDHRYWSILAVMSLVFSFDEGASIHELATQPLQRLLGQNLPGYLHFAWVIPAAILVIVILAFFLKFFFSLPRRTQILFFISVFVYISGVLGMEMISANYAEINGIKNIGYNVFVTLEETLEITGMVIAIYALLDYIQKKASGISFQIL